MAAGEETGPGSEDRLGLDEAQWLWFRAYTRGYGQQGEQGGGQQGIFCRLGGQGSGQHTVSGHTSHGSQQG